MPYVVPRREAIQYTGDNATEVIALAGGGEITEDGLWIDVWGGYMQVGWWIVKAPWENAEIMFDAPFAEQYVVLP
jgi:hypothetical protein